MRRDYGSNSESDAGRAERYRGGRDSDAPTRAEAEADARELSDRDE